MNSLKIACVTPKGKDPVFAICGVVDRARIYPQRGDHHYHQGELVLVNWRTGDFYRETRTLRLLVRRDST